MGNEHVLLVDDDRDCEFLLRHAFTLEAPDIRLHCIQDGKTAIDYLQGKPPHQKRILPRLMLLDLKMPGMDGFDILEWLQRTPSVRPKYLLVCTTSNLEYESLRAQQLGADGFIIKPGAFAELRQQVTVIAHYARTGLWTAHNLPNQPSWFRGDFPRH